MAELREPAHSSMWPSYGSSAHASSRVNSAIQTGLSSSGTTSPHPARPRSSQANVEAPYPYRYPQDEADAYDRQVQPNLSSQGYPSLKRPFSQTEPPAYQEIVQDLRDDGSRMSVNHDHKLLAFRRAHDKHTIVDQQGRIHQLEISAQLHGMFFLSEMPASTGDGNVLQPELTCYRRNLFQISGSLITPRGQLSVISETGDTVAVSNMEVTISAIESVDNNPVRLIVIPWKTPPPNSAEISQGPDQEPPSLPLIPFQDDGTETDGEYAVYPIGWRRLQFRIATANNGRRKELQQHFVLHLKVIGTLSNGSSVVLTESITAPIVVRGRSPRNFQARKEIPLLGSSAGSRGQALVETGVGVVAGALSAKLQEVKPRSIDPQLPRTAFTFSAPKLQGSQLASMRSNSFPAWGPSSHLPMSQMASSSPSNYPATTMGSDPYPKGPLSGAPSFTAEPQEMPLQTSMAPAVQLSLVSSDQRPQYTYVHSSTAPTPHSLSSTSLSGPDPALNVPRYVDNPRGVKSPRHNSHQSAHSSSSVSNSEASPEYRYGSYAPTNNSSGEGVHATYNTEATGQQSAPPRDYYPPTNTWTTTASEHNASAAYTSSERPPYPFVHEPYNKSATSTPPVKHEPNQPPPPTVYSGGVRSSFDNLPHYAWSTG